MKADSYYTGHRHTQTNTDICPSEPLGQIQSSAYGGKTDRFYTAKTASNQIFSYCKSAINNTLLRSDAAFVQTSLPRRRFSEDGSSVRKISAMKCIKHFIACPCQSVPALWNAEPIPLGWSG